MKLLHSAGKETRLTSYLLGDGCPPGRSSGHLLLLCCCCCCCRLPFAVVQIKCLLFLQRPRPLHTVSIFIVGHVWVSVPDQQHKIYFLSQLLLLPPQLFILLSLTTRCRLELRLLGRQKLLQSKTKQPQSISIFSLILLCQPLYCYQSLSFFPLVPLEKHVFSPHNCMYVIMMVYT